MNRNGRAAVWLLTDMCLHIGALILVKTLGASYPTMQIVFIRAATGLLVLLPWMVISHRSFASISHWPLHIARIVFSSLAISCGYYAVARVPLALFTTLNYLRPAVLMLMAMLLLNEFIGKRRWFALTLGFIGVLIAVQPGDYSFNLATAVLLVAVIAGSTATILLRRLKGAPEIVMMVFYTAGLMVCTAPFAVAQWVPIANQDGLAILAIGVLAQCAQLCFLRAHWTGDVGFLSPLTYSSLILSAAAGYFVFDEIPTTALIIGAGFILLSAVLANRRERS
ncbi:MAG: DMT family transporter [Gammaproteobacteria bacterium]|nr:DMT family transporter [Gammaproteobacteria bacterium]